MNNKVKSYIILFLLGVILYPSVIHIVVLKINHYSLKQQVKQSTSISNSETILIKINTPEEYKYLEWMDDEEFYFKSELFDLVKKEKIGNVLCLYAIKDRQEIELIKELKSIVLDDILNGLDIHKSEKGKSVVQQLFKKAIYYQDYCLKSLVNIKLDNKQAFHFFNFYRSISIDRLVPPPKVCSFS